MNISIQPKETSTLAPTDILFQTAYWSQVKSRLGWQPIAFDFQTSTGQQGDMMVLLKPLGRGLATAYVPQGPEAGPPQEMYGLFLEALSQELVKHMDSGVAFIRYDLPWESPYAEGAASGTEDWRPTPRLRELRMNIGTRNWNLRKATLDVTVADAVMIDLSGTEADILAAMKPKTRYNIRLAQRKGVRVVEATLEKLTLFYELYLQTAKRNGFVPGSYRHFSALFSPLALHPGSAEILLLLASKGQDVLAGAIIAISGRRALYLFGASADTGRNLMCPYAVHWAGIRRARAKGCLTYDMGSVSPGADPRHPFYGMYRFKTGFGGQIVHRNGSWDYPLDRSGYEAFRNFETTADLRLSEWDAW